jgi:hypothetical protein
MLNNLIYLLAFLFAADVDALGSRSFEVRTAAHLRLLDAGFWSAPAVLAGSRSPCQERQWRCRSIYDATTGQYRRLYTACRWMAKQHDYPVSAAWWSFPPVDRELLAIACCPDTSDIVHRLAAGEGVFFELSFYSSTDIKTMTADERYWLFRDLGRMPKPIRKPVPHLMEKP